jgi:hypothetical protein
MALSSQNIESVRNTKSQGSNPIDDIQENVLSSVKDPFGAIITNVISKLGNLTSSVEIKINQLSDDLIKSVDNKGRVTIQGNTIVISVEPEDAQEANAIKENISNKIRSIQKSLTVLKTTLQTLNTIQTGISTLQTALTIQELALSSNPGTGPIYQVLKQGIKIIFLKDIIKEYSSILKKQLKQNLKSFERISEKFKNLQVSVIIQDEKNKGNDMTFDEATKVIASQLLSNNENDNTTESVTEEYIDNNQVEYVLKVEKYQEDKIIARAYEKKSGLIKQQTSPSFFSTPEELLEELKTILNIQS